MPEPARGLPETAPGRADGTVTPYGPQVSEQSDAIPEPTRPARPLTGGMLRQLIRISWQALAIGLGVYLVLPQLAGLEATAQAIARANWWLAPLALALEGGRLIAFGELVRVVLCGIGQRPPGLLVQRATVAGYALGRVLPGGSTAALAVIVSALRTGGLAALPTTTGVAASGLIASFTLTVLLTVGALVAVAAGNSGGITVGVLGMAGVALAIAVGARLAVRSPAAAGRWTAHLARSVLRGPLRRRLPPERLGLEVERAVSGANQLARDRRALNLSLFWAMVSWLLEASVLFLLAFTIGAGGIPVSGLLLAYALGQYAASAPITPGGVGVVEAVMTATLIATGANVGDATAVVLGYRLVTHWLPILLGLALLPTLGWGRRSGNGDGDGGIPSREPTTP